MPAVRPRASFEPLPPDLDIAALVESTDNFQYVDRISLDKIRQHGQEKFEQLVLLHVIMKGKPLVIDGFKDVLSTDLFGPGWLEKHYGDKVENARDLTAQSYIPLTIRHYLKHMSPLTDQFFESNTNFKDKQRQRVYLKDIDCPTEWEDKVRELVPLGLMYLNECSGMPGGPGSVLEPKPDGSGMALGAGVGSAGDLMSSLPPKMRAENLMCYIGHEGTFTPAHREMCASLGQNLMVHASSTAGPDGKAEQPGSSVWFMTETSDRHLVAEYWLSVLGHDIEVEKHFAQLAAWKNAPFKTYIVEQKVGDFILVPPLAPHQVWNRGTRTVKVAWNRTTVETLEKAFEEALPNQKMVCRDEQYKNKAIVYFTLQKYATVLNIVRTRLQNGSPEEIERLRRSRKIRQVQKDFNRLFAIFKSIILSESFSLDPTVPEETPEYMEYDSNITCAYCRGNIFNRFLTCKSCVDIGTGVDEPYDICMECYIMGRSCKCQSMYTWVEQFRWDELVENYEKWRELVIASGSSSRALPLIDEHRRYENRTLAELCQSQLVLRPWVNIKQSDPEHEEEEEDSFEETKKRYHRFGTGQLCHVCKNPHPEWKAVQCSSCERWWCYGTLWRAHDLMPQTVLENPMWECPHCKRVCNTGACRRDARQTPYEPKGTLLGHDTKLVADPRSVECLVDFSRPNSNWIRISDRLFKENGSDERTAGNVRLHRRLAEAENEKVKDPVLDDRYAKDDDDLIPPPAKTMCLPEAMKEIEFEDDGSVGDMSSAGFADSADVYWNQAADPSGLSWNSANLSNPSFELHRKKLGSVRLEGDAEREYLENARRKNRLLQALGLTRGLCLVVALKLPAQRLRTFAAAERSRLVGLHIARLGPKSSLLESNVLKNGGSEPRKVKSEPKSKTAKKAKDGKVQTLKGKGKRRASGFGRPVSSDENNPDSGESSPDESDPTYGQAVPKRKRRAPAKRDGSPQIASERPKRKRKQISSGVSDLTGADPIFYPSPGGGGEAPVEWDSFERFNPVPAPDFASQMNQPLYPVESAGSIESGERDQPGTSQSIPLGLSEFEDTLRIATAALTYSQPQPLAEIDPASVSNTAANPLFEPEPFQPSTSAPLDRQLSPEEDGGDDSTGQPKPVYRSIFDRRRGKKIRIGSAPGRQDGESKRLRQHDHVGV